MNTQNINEFETFQYQLKIPQVKNVDPCDSMPDEIQSSCMQNSTHRVRPISPIRARPSFPSPKRDDKLATFRAPITKILANS